MMHTETEGCVASTPVAIRGVEVQTRDCRCTIRFSARRAHQSGHSVDRSIDTRRRSEEIQRIFSRIA